MGVVQGDGGAFVLNGAGASEDRDELYELKAKSQLPRPQHSVQRRASHRTDKSEFSSLRRVQMIVDIILNSVLGQAYPHFSLNMPQWREQYDRTLRWHARFTELNSGRIHDRASDNYIDEIYAFFQNCYHLKDWLKNDATVDRSVRDKVESFINAERPLRLCADICISLKHLRIDRPRSGEHPRFGGRHFGVNLGSGPTTLSVRHVVETNVGPEDAYALACQCVDAWKAFISMYSLP